MKPRCLALAFLLGAPQSSALVRPLLTAQEPLTEKGSRASTSLVNRWIATNAALTWHRGRRVDEEEMNRFLKGCEGRVMDGGVVALEFPSGLIVLTAAREDAPFRMRRAGFRPEKPIREEVGGVAVWYAQDGSGWWNGGPGGEGRRLTIAREVFHEVSWEEAVKMFREPLDWSVERTVRAAGIAARSV